MPILSSPSYFPSSYLFSIPHFLSVSLSLSFTGPSIPPYLLIGHTSNPEVFSMRPGKKWKQFTFKVSKGVKDSMYLEMDSLEG